MSSGVSKERGFTLMEALVATTIIGLVAVASMAAYGGQLRGALQARTMLAAAALAEDRLALIRMLPRSELERLPDSIRRGEFPAPFSEYTWEASADLDRDTLGLANVTVRVRWDDRTFALETRLFRPEPRYAGGGEE